jgi:hypothetical protein
MPEMDKDARRENRLAAFAVIELALRLIDERGHAEDRAKELDAIMPDPDPDTAVPDPKMVAVEAATILVSLIDASGVTRRVLRELLRQERESVLGEE